MGEFGGLKFVVDAKLVIAHPIRHDKVPLLTLMGISQVMYGASKRFVYTSFENGNAMGDSVGHFDRIILKGAYERVKFNQYHFVCEEVTSRAPTEPQSANPNKTEKYFHEIKCVLFCLAGHIPQDSQTVH